MKRNNIFLPCGCRWEIFCQRTLWRCHNVQRKWRNLCRGRLRNDAHYRVSACVVYFQVLMAKHHITAYEEHIIASHPHHLWVYSRYNGGHKSQTKNFFSVAYVCGKKNVFPAVFTSQAEKVTAALCCYPPVGPYRQSYVYPFM